MPTPYTLVNTIWKKMSAINLFEVGVQALNSAALRSGWGMAPSALRATESGKMETASLPVERFARIGQS